MSKFIKNLIGTFFGNKKNHTTVVPPIKKIKGTIPHNCPTTNENIYSTTNNEYIQKLVESTIDPSILEKISSRQALAYKIEGLKDNNVECCICFENGVNFVPILCGHEICSVCYITLEEKSIKICPICNKTMELVDVNKCYAIMSKIKNSIGIIYLPPIFNDEDNTWTENEICFDKDRFNNATKKINKENYFVVLGTTDTIYGIKTFSNSSLDSSTNFNIAKL